MNTLRNKVQLIGNLGNDPEIITLESGKKLAKFSLATNENYKDANGDKQIKTDWHNIVAWNKTADIIEKYVTKGKEIAIEGKLTNRSYETKEGEKRYITEVVVNEILMFTNHTIYKWNKAISNPNYLNTKKIIEFMGYDPRINNPLKIENYELLRNKVQLNIILGQDPEIITFEENVLKNPSKILTSAQNINVSKDKNGRRRLSTTR